MEQREQTEAQVRAARLSVASNTLLVVSKLAVGLATGSVGVLSETVHSGLDLAASVLALTAVRVAARPPDAEHPFGHGKAQHVSALIEGLLIVLAAGLIAYEAVGALRAGHGPRATAPGMVIMAVSATVNLTVSRRLFAVARRAQSAALEADALHLRTDVWSSAGVFAALAAVAVTGVEAFDPAAALVVAAIILRASFRPIRRAVMALMDTRLREEEERAIFAAVQRHGAHFVELHDLRTRRAGARRYVDFHLVVHGLQPLNKVHALCDRIEATIEHALPGTDVLIHPEPCGEGCPRCAGTMRGE